MIRKIRGRAAMARLGILPAAMAAVLLMAGTAGAATTWTREPVPQSGPADGPILQSVSCPTATACMTVSGGGGTGGSVGGAFTDYWNGTSWTLETIPSAATTNLTAVSCRTAAWCIAVGSTSSAHPKPVTLLWNGTRWAARAVSMPAGDTSGTLDGVSCVSTSDCVAVGGGDPTTFSETWNGSKWTPVDMPGTGDDLLGVSCTAATSCVAVGGGDNGLTDVADSWNGTSWTALTLPSVGGYGDLKAVSCSSVSSCTAVGVDGDGGARALIDQWNGTTWTNQPNTGAGSTSSELWGVVLRHRLHRGG
jgi:hypothetical protein